MALKTTRMQKRNNKKSERVWQVSLSNTCWDILLLLYHRRIVGCRHCRRLFRLFPQRSTKIWPCSINELLFIIQIHRSWSIVYPTEAPTLRNLQLKKKNLISIRFDSSKDSSIVLSIIIKKYFKPHQFVSHIER